MNAHGDLALWILNSLLNAGGSSRAAHAWNTRYINKYARLIWLVPAVLLRGLACRFLRGAVCQSGNLFPPRTVFAARHRG